MLVCLDSRASTVSPFLGTGSDKVTGQSDTFLTARTVLYICAGMTGAFPVGVWV